MSKNILVLSRLVTMIYIQKYQNFYKIITIIGVKNLTLFAKENNGFHDTKLIIFCVVITSIMVDYCTYNVDHHVMHTHPIFNLPTSPNNIMSNNDQIEASLANLELQEVLNYSTIAKKHGVVRTTLMRRFIGKTVSYCKANTEY